MNRSLTTGIIITVAIITALAVFFYINYIKVKSVPALNAIPNDAALIIETKNIENSWANFLQSDMFRDLQKNETVSHLSHRISVIDSLVNLNPELKELLAENKIAVSFHAQGGQKLNILFVAETGSKIDLLSFSNKIAQTNQYTIRKRTFENESIFDLLDKDKMSVLSIAYRDQLLICSTEGTLVEESVRKLKYKLPNNTQGLEQISNMSEVGSDASVFINYQYFSQFIDLFTKSEYYGLFTYLKRFANWSMFDLKITKEQLNFSGLSYTDDSVFQYLDLFKTQSPVEMSLHKMLPKNTAMYLQTSYSDFPKFSADLTEYLQVHKKLDSYIHYTDSLENRYSINLGDNLIAVLGNEAILAMLEPMGSDYEKDLFAFIKTKNKTAAEALFKGYATAIDKRGEHDSLPLTTYNGYAIEHLQLGNFLKQYYGEIFENISSPYYTFINDVIVFTNNINTLKMIIDNYASGNTFDKDEQYKKFSASSAASSNINFFFSPNRCFMLPSGFITDDFLSVMNRYQYDFKKFEYISVQFANTNNKAFFTHINIKYSPSFAEDTRILWTVKIDTTFASSPAMVYNSATKQNCILVQDVNNVLYFINNSGNILWKTKISGKVISNFTQIEPQKNGKTYFLFNTDKQACLIDENGSNMSGYPVKFPGTATASLSIFDFKGDSNYQFFVPLDNNRIMGYQIGGKPILGWNPKTIDEKISAKIASIRIKSESYILATGLKGNLLMYSLKGERIKQETGFVLNPTVQIFTSVIDSANAFVALTDTNSIFNIFSIDSTLKLATNQTYKLSIHPEYVQAVMNDLTKDWIVLSGDKKEFSVFDKANHKSFSIPVVDSIFSRPFLNNTVSGDIMIGYTSKSTNKINWYTKQGTEYPSFPIDGSSTFCVGNLMMNGGNYIVSQDKLNNVLLIKLK